MRGGDESHTPLLAHLKMPSSSWTQIAIPQFRSISGFHLSKLMFVAVYPLLKDPALSVLKLMNVWPGLADPQAFSSGLSDEDNRSLLIYSLRNAVQEGDLSLVDGPNHVLSHGFMFALLANLSVVLKHLVQDVLDEDSEVFEAKSALYAEHEAVSLGKLIVKWAQRILGFLGLLVNDACTDCDVQRAKNLSLIIRAIREVALLLCKFENAKEMRQKLSRYYLRTDRLKMLLEGPAPSGQEASESKEETAAHKANADHTSSFETAFRFTNANSIWSPLPAYSNMRSAAVSCSDDLRTLLSCLSCLLVSRGGHALDAEQKFRHATPQDTWEGKTNQLQKIPMLCSEIATLSSLSKDQLLELISTLIESMYQKCFEMYDFRWNKARQPDTQDDGEMFSYTMHATVLGFYAVLVPTLFQPVFQHLLATWSPHRNEVVDTVLESCVGYDSGLSWRVSAALDNSCLPCGRPWLTEWLSVLDEVEDLDYVVKLNPLYDLHLAEMAAFYFPLRDDFDDVDNAKKRNGLSVSVSEVLFRIILWLYFEGFLCETDPQDRFFVGDSIHSSWTSLQPTSAHDLTPETIRFFKPLWSAGHHNEGSAQLPNDMKKTLLVRVRKGAAVIHARFKFREPSRKSDPCEFRKIMSVASTFSFFWQHNSSPEACFVKCCDTLIATLLRLLWGCKAADDWNYMKYEYGFPATDQSDDDDENASSYTPSRSVRRLSDRIDVLKDVLLPRKMTQLIYFALVDTKGRNDVAEANSQTKLTPEDGNTDLRMVARAPERSEDSTTTTETSSGAATPDPLRHEDLKLLMSKVDTLLDAQTQIISKCVAHTDLIREHTDRLEHSASQTKGNTHQLGVHSEQIEELIKKLENLGREVRHCTNIIENTAQMQRDELKKFVNLFSDDGEDDAALLRRLMGLKQEEAFSSRSTTPGHLNDDPLIPKATKSRSVADFSSPNTAMSKWDLEIHDQASSRAKSETLVSRGFSEGSKTANQNGVSLQPFRLCAEKTEFKNLLAKHLAKGPRSAKGPRAETQRTHSATDPAHQPGPIEEKRVQTPQSAKGVEPDDLVEFRESPPSAKTQHRAETDPALMSAIQAALAEMAEAHRNAFESECSKLQDTFAARMSDLAHEQEPRLKRVEQQIQSLRAERDALEARPPCPSFDVDAVVEQLLSRSKNELSLYLSTHLMNCIHTTINSQLSCLAPISTEPDLFKGEHERTASPPVLIETEFVDTWDTSSNSTSPQREAEFETESEAGHQPASSVSWQSTPSLGSASDSPSWYYVTDRHHDVAPLPN